MVATANRGEDYAAMLNRYRHPTTPQDEQRHLHALAQFPDVERALATFDLAMDEVRSQDAPYVVADLLRNRVAGPAVWGRATEEWDRLLARFPVNSDSRWVSSVRILCGDPELARSIHRFLASHRVRAGERTVRQSLERLDIYVEFGRQHRATLGAVLGRVAGGAAS